MSTTDKYDEFEQESLKSMENEKGLRQTQFERGKDAGRPFSIHCQIVRVRKWDSDKQ